MDVHTHIHTFWYLLYILTLPRVQTFNHDDAFFQCSGRVFQQTVGIPMGTNCAQLHADLFLHSYEVS